MTSLNMDLTVASLHITDESGKAYSRSKWTNFHRHSAHWRMCSSGIFI